MHEKLILECNIMLDIESKAVVGEDGELLEADQAVDMNIYAEYVEAAFPDPTRFHRLLNYISGNIFRSSMFLLIVIFVAIAIMAILSLQITPQTTRFIDLQPAEVQQGIAPTLAPTRNWQPLLVIPTPEPQPIRIPMPTRPPRETNVIRV